MNIVKTFYILRKIQQKCRGGLKKYAEGKKGSEEKLDNPKRISLKMSKTRFHKE